MHKRRYSCRSLLWSGIQIAVGATLLFLVACWRIGGELPTRAPTAEVPTLAIGEKWATLPATFTPQPGGLVANAPPTYVATPAATSTLPGNANIPISAPPATATATPYVAPDYLRQEVAVEDYELPPLTTDCDGTGVVFQSRYPSSVGGPLRDYHVYLPPCYGQDGRVYPVLYLLHGSGWDDMQWVDLGIAQHIDHGLAEGRYPPFIVIMPNNMDLDDETSGGQRSVEGTMMENLVPFVDSTFCTWNSREGRSIGGISRGGYWALMLAFRYTDLFGFVSGHSSQLRLDVDPPQYNPLATWAEADLSQTGIWLDWGESDFLRPGQKRLHEALMNAGIPHSVNIYPGNHARYYWYAHAGEYMDWHASNWPLDRSAYPFCELELTQ